MTEDTAFKKAWRLRRKRLNLLAQYHTRLDTLARVAGRDPDQERADLLRQVEEIERDPDYFYTGWL